MNLLELDISDYKKIIKDSNPEADLYSFISSRGYVLVGKGFFSRVYGKPGSSVVLKIGSFGRDDRFTYYIEYVRSKPRNIHLPRIGVPRYLTGNNREYYVVPMEKLEKLTESQKAIILNIVKYVKENKETWLDLDLEVLKRYNIIDQLDVLKILVDLNSIPNKDYDIKPDNFMSRNNNIVVTDPIS